MPADKPRIFHNARDMFLSLGVLLLIIVPMVGLTGMCSFGSTPEMVPEERVDAHTILQMDANGLAFPVRYPALPEGYVANSARRADIAGAPSSITGFLSPDADYAELTQTSATVAELVGDIDGRARTRSGETTINGEVFTIYSGDDARDLWVADLGEVRIGITGAGNPQIYETMATAITSAEPLTPAGR